MLLSKRSIIIEVCLALIVGHSAVSAAEYDYSETDELHSEYADDHSHPDYTKYFGGEASPSAAVANKQSPGITSGFVAPAEFESFWNIPITFDDPNPKATAPRSFVAQSAPKADPFEALKQSFAQKEAASEPNPLKQDYFEESQKRQRAESSEVKPGPYYVSHKIPGPQVYDESTEEGSQSKDDVETIRPPVKGKNKEKPKAGSDYDGYNDSFNTFEISRKTEEQADQTKDDPATYYGSKNVDYNTGKSSSTVSQFPAARGYLAQIPTTSINPYSYQPLHSKYLESLIAPAEKSDGATSPSETAAKNIKNKNCRKINGPENAEGMNCFVCEDASNKAKYTQCSYTSSEEPVNQYAGSSIRYSAPVKAPESLRHKRSPGSSEYDRDPYFEVSQRNRKYFDDFDKEQEAAESERKKDFHYTPYDPEEYESYSASQSSELLKKPGACTKVQREGGETCTVCKDETTGGNFEQCSYTSAPKESKYAYVAEKKFDSEHDQPEETKTVTKQSSEPHKSSATKSKIIVKDPIPELSGAATTIAEEAEEESDSSEDKEAEDAPPTEYYYGELKKDKKLVSDDPYDVPEHFAATVTDKKTTQEDDDAEQESFDEYHYKLFPELNKEKEEEEESKSEEQKTDATEQKQHDVEEVLLEFAKKDRSNCKKAEKKGMTCFLCVDQNKVQHEECMYVAESKPKPTHIAYHEVQRLKDPEGEHQPLINPQESNPEESKKVETVTPKPVDLATKKKKFFKKVPQLTAAASDVYRTVVPYEKQKKRYSKTTVRDSKASGSAPDSERLEESESKDAEEEEESKEDDSKEETKEDPETPKEVDVGQEEGAYSHETKPVYSKLFGTTLPKYMVEKTEFEKEFDAASGFD